jgi:hypothetical protein
MDQASLHKPLAALLVLAAVTLTALVLHQARAVTLAQSGQEYNLSWWTVDGGGATFSENGGYSLGSTIGQSDAAVWDGSSYTLAGGFWGGAVMEYHVCLPLVLRDF